MKMERCLSDRDKYNDINDSRAKFVKTEFQKETRNGVKFTLFVLRRESEITNF